MHLEPEKIRHSLIHNFLYFEPLQPQCPTAKNLHVSEETTNKNKGDMCAFSTTF